MNRSRKVQVCEGHIFWKKTFKFLDQNALSYVDSKKLISLSDLFIYLVFYKFNSYSPIYYILYMYELLSFHMKINPRGVRGLNENKS